MNLNPIASNMTVLTLNDGTEILFSYKTPVACKNWKNGTGEALFQKTETRWSNTTTRHINKFFGSFVETGKIESKPQEFFDGLVK